MKHAAALAFLSLSLPAAAAFNYWDAADTAKAPRTLSATGVYADIRAGRMAAEAKPFEVNSPLWSDGAHKKRWVLLKPGRSIAFSEHDDYWGYPDSAVFIKQFAIDTVAGDTASRKRWETRLMINKREVRDSATGVMTDRWYGFSYKWNASGTDANLVGFEDVNDSIRVFPKGKSQPAVMKKWTFPAQRCDQCHLSRQYDVVRSRSVLGFFTAQLNRPSAANPSRNQLDELFDQGVLKGVRPASWAASPRWRAIDDSGASVNVRARSYLAANCSGCHGTRGNANSAAERCTINFDYQNMDDSLFEFRHRYAGNYGTEENLPLYYPITDLGNNPLGLDSFFIAPELVVPGYPQKSAILARQMARNTTPGDYDGLYRQMPPVGSFEVNDPAMVVLAQWIKSLPATQAPGALALADHRIRPQRSPFLRGRILALPAGLEGGAVSMLGLNGRALALRRLGPGVFMIPADAPQGLYFIRVGNRSFRQYLL
jgi:hypothetical protein